MRGKVLKRRLTGLGVRNHEDCALFTATSVFLGLLSPSRGILDWSHVPLNFLPGSIAILH